MIKMDMIWIAAAMLIYPKTSLTFTVTRIQIEEKVANLFGADLTPIMIERHLVSWEDRQANKTFPTRGGNRARYLFRTEDGKTPSRKGQYRLYKNLDGNFDGIDKTGRTHPDKADIPLEYHNLIEWYLAKYYP